MTEAVVGQLLEVGGGETRIWREKRQRDKFLELGRTREREGVRKFCLSRRDIAIVHAHREWLELITT